MTEKELNFVSGDALATELRTRRSPWLMRSVPLALLPQLIQDGWGSSAQTSEVSESGSESSQIARSRMTCGPFSRVWVFRS